MTMDCIVVKHIIGTLTARSTICNFPILRCCWPSSPFSLLSIVMVNIAWERDEVAFILVDPTAPNSWIRNIGVSWPNCTWKQPHQANAARRKPEIKQIDHFKVFHQFWSRLPQGHSPIFKVGGFPRFLKDIPKCLCVCVGVFGVQQQINKKQYSDVASDNLPIGFRGKSPLYHIFAINYRSFQC